MKDDSFIGWTRDCCDLCAYDFISNLLSKVFKVPNGQHTCCTGINNSVLDSIHLKPLKCSTAYKYHKTHFHSLLLLFILLLLPSAFSPPCVFYFILFYYKLLNRLVIRYPVFKFLFYFYWIFLSCHALINSPVVTLKGFSQILADDPGPWGSHYGQHLLTRWEISFYIQL
jgi:hypothetical protein